MRLPKTLMAELDRLFRRGEREKRNWQIAEDYENRIAELRADGKSDLTDQAARDVEVNHGLKGEGRQSNGPASVLFRGEVCRRFATCCRPQVSRRFNETCGQAV